MSSPLEVMDKIERTSRGCVDAPPATVVVLHSQFQSLRAAIESQAAELAHLKSAIHMSHLVALMDGLEIPDPIYWVQRPPSDLKEVGRAIANQAKEAKDAEVAESEELAQARARIVRLEEWLKSKRTRFKGGMGSPLLPELDALLNESPAQSAAALKAEALREYANTMDKENPQGDSQIVSFAWGLRSEADRIEREAKESGS